MAAKVENILLEFDAVPKVREDLSAVVRVGDDLWLGCDEGTNLDRVSLTRANAFGAHKRFKLAEILGLDDDEQEIDIEGIDYADGYLWLVGSHSLKRKGPKPGFSLKKNLKRLAKVESEKNRHLLARIPINENREPVSRDGDRRVSILERTKYENVLTEALRLDNHLAPFVPIPSKDNGLDIEGLAVRGKTAFVGLRGPVLRGWATLLRLDLSGLSKSEIKLKQPPTKIFLQLGGFGFRDMVIDGDDLLILAGPSMDIDGSVLIYRWRGGASASDSTFVFEDTLEKYEVRKVDDASGKAEGLAKYDDRLLVVYDSPVESRLVGDKSVDMDLVTLT